MQAMWQQNVRQVGITEMRPEGLQLCWSASGIEFETKARNVSVEIESESTCGQEDAFLGVFYNGNCRWEKRIRIMPGRRWYEIGTDGISQNRKIGLLKLTEEQYAKVRILSVKADAPVFPTAKPERSILFVGDSLTAGYGVTGKDGISVFQTADEDVTLAYAYLAGAALGVATSIVAYSGNGVLSRWIPPEVDAPRTDDILPEIFPYAKMETPDLIVCNLGTNDASYTRKIAQREDAFVKAYIAFIERLHQAAPDAQIILAYGLMERTLCERVREVAERCHIDFLELPLQNESYGMGTDGHPCAKTQQETAEYLQMYIRKKKKW